MQMHDQVSVKTEENHLSVGRIPNRFISLHHHHNAIPTANPLLAIIPPKQ